MDIKLIDTIYKLNIDTVTQNIDDNYKEQIKEGYRGYLEDMYKDYDFEDETFEEAFLTIAQKRGALSKGGIPDYEKVSNIVINDLKNGLLGNITLDRM